MQVALYSLRGCPVPKLVVPTTTVASRSTVISKSVTVTNTLSDQAAFTPNPVAILTSRLDYLVGETATLISTAATHYRQTTLLGSPAQVRFEPVATRWLIDGSRLGEGAIATALLAAAGSHQLELQVDYSASYRFDLAAAFSYAGLITDVATVTLSATQPAPPAKPARAHLVWSTCALHPSNYRC